MSAQGSRDFGGVASWHLYTTSPAITAKPLAMVAWFRRDTTIDATDDTIVCLSDSGNSNGFLRLTTDVQGSAAIVAHSQEGGGGNARAILTDSGMVNTWRHGAAVFLSNTERHVYIDGPTNKASDTTSNTGSEGNTDQWSVGSNRRNSAIWGFAGQICEVAIWDLTNWGSTDADRESNFEKCLAALALGFSPIFWPVGLKHYWPMSRLWHPGSVSGEIDVVGGADLVEAGTVNLSTQTPFGVAGGPQYRLPIPPQIGLAAGGGGGGVSPALWIASQQASLIGSGVL